MEEPDRLFGGLHFILCGDYYQMKAMDGTCVPEGFVAINNQYNNKSFSRETAEGIKIMKQLTHFVELKTNVRAATEGDKKTDLAIFNTAARLNQLATPEIQDIFTKFNCNIGINEEDLYARTNRDTLHLTDTHAKIKHINAFNLSKLLQNEGNTLVKVIADHKPHGFAQPMTRGVRDHLYSNRGNPKGTVTELSATHIDLTIGSRVRVTQNLATVLGLYNGRMGTVYGFVWKRKQIHDANSSSGEEEGRSGMVVEHGAAGDKTSAAAGGAAAVATTKSKKKLEKKLFCDYTEVEREIPIVLVKLDASKRYKLSKNDVVPFMPVDCMKTITMLGNKTDKYVRRQLPLLPAHGRTTHATQGITAENDVIVDVSNQFYGGLYVAISRAKELSNIFLTKAMKSLHFNIDNAFRQIVSTFYGLLYQKFPQNTRPPPSPLFPPC